MRGMHMLCRQAAQGRQAGSGRQNGIKVRMVVGSGYIGKARTCRDTGKEEKAEKAGGIQAQKAGSRDSRSTQRRRGGKVWAGIVGIRHREDTDRRVAGRHIVIPLPRQESREEGYRKKNTHGTQATHRQRRSMAEEGSVSRHGRRA